MEDKRILVIGGTGYIGKEIVKVLSKKNYVSVMSRHSGNLKGSVTNKKFLFEKLKDFDVIVYLAAIVRSFNKFKYKENVVGLQNTLDAMKANDIKKIFYFSTQNIFIPKTGWYGNSKKECEKILKQSDVDYMIVRPNYVYGLDKKNDFFKLFNIMRMFKVCPIIGNGRTKIQPINKEDVAALSVKLIYDWKSKFVFNFSGKTTISLAQIADLIKRKKKIMCFTLYIPVFLLQPFKFLIPFDVKGYSYDRVAPENHETLYGESNIEEDIKKIIEL